MNEKLRPIKFFLLILFISVCAAQARAEYVPIASYKIDVRLDAKKKLISGQEKIYFLNTSTKNLDTLYLHLFPNAFSSDSTIFVRESDYLKNLMKKEEYRGYLKIKAVKDEKGEINYKVNETVMGVYLPEPLKPGKEVELSCEFELKLPEISSRMGYDQNNFLLCEWFPKMAVLDKDGTWHNFPNHYMTEFFSDFGMYYRTRFCR